MGQPIKLIIKKGAVRKDGTSLIFLQYCHSVEQRILLSTDVPIPQNYWNKKTGRIADHRCHADTCSRYKTCRYKKT